jgi:hypothetical protein
VTIDGDYVITASSASSGSETPEIIAYKLP